MQAFISYAHTPADTALARYVAARLRGVRIDVWLDESSLTAGGLLQEDIERAIAKSDAGIFLMSQSWMASEWTAFGSSSSIDDPHVVRRIPVFRLPRGRTYRRLWSRHRHGLAGRRRRATRDSGNCCAITNTPATGRRVESPPGPKLSSKPIPPPAVARD
jgi:hypothetical protein